MQVPFRLCKRGAAAKLMKRVRRGGREVFGIQNLCGLRTGLPEGEAAFRSVSRQRVSLHGAANPTSSMLVTRSASSRSSWPESHNSLAKVTDERGLSFAGA